MTAGGVLIAGLGNVLFADDGFGVVVADRLSDMTLPAGVVVRSFGVRGLDVAFAMMQGYSAAILLDAVGRGHDPGTVVVIDPEVPGHAWPRDSPGLDPLGMLAMLEASGLPRPRLRVVGCEPAVLTDDETGLSLGLSPVVHDAVPRAVAMVLSLVEELVGRRS